MGTKQKMPPPSPECSAQPSLSQQKVPYDELQDTVNPGGPLALECQLMQAVLHEPAAAPKPSADKAGLDGQERTVPATSNGTKLQSCLLYLPRFS